MSASEFFPQVLGSAFYVLSLRKSVHEPGQVLAVEEDLLSALDLLAMAWPFSGGSFMVIDSRQLGVSTRCESNGERLRSELLAARGEAFVSSSVAVPSESGATYLRPPLHTASIVAKAAADDYNLCRLLRYHQDAWLGYHDRPRYDRSSWFIDLYKVRDLLKKLYGGEKAAKLRLAIASSDWSLFGRILNDNDLRHATVAGVVPPVATEDLDRLFCLARDWIRAHLKVIGLPLS